MNVKVSDIFFIRRRSDGSIKIGIPRIVRTAGQDEHPKAELKPGVTTMADSLTPLLTSMKLFGLYFKSETCEKSEEEWLRHGKNLNKYHSAFVTVMMWINVIRMFSVFTNSFLTSSDLFLLLRLIFTCFVLSSYTYISISHTRCSQHKRNLANLSSSSSFEHI